MRAGAAVTGSRSRPDSYDAVIVPEARLERTDTGLVPSGEGWFVLNAREGRWRVWDGLGARLSVEGDTDFPRVGINLYALAPGSRSACTTGRLPGGLPRALGEALLIVEGEQRHCASGISSTARRGDVRRPTRSRIGAREHPPEVP